MLVILGFDLKKKKKKERKKREKKEREREKEKKEIPGFEPTPIFIQCFRGIRLVQSATEACYIAM